MRGPMLRPIVIAAGGTGGHLFPAEALAAELVSRGERVVLMTDRRSGAFKSPVFARCETMVLAGAGLAGRGLLDRARALGGLALGIVQARRAFTRLHPGAVVGFGGYPSFPPLIAARLIGSRWRPATILHEQNAVLGRANRALAARVDGIALSFPDTTGLRPEEAAKVRVTGNPVRPAIAALSGRGYVPPGIDAPLSLLVLGGSLGARIFSDIVPAALSALDPCFRRRLRVTQQCRAEDLARVQAAYAAAGVQAELSTFFGDVAERLASAHLLVVRAGASTVAEVAVAGRPAVFVPLPGAIDDHQSANARAICAAGGGWLMPQPDFTPEALKARLEDLLAVPAALARAAAAAVGFGRPDAAQALADFVLSLKAGEPAAAGTTKETA